MATTQDLQFKIFRLNSEHSFTMPVKEKIGGAPQDVRVDFTITDGNGNDISDKITIFSVSLPVGFYDNPTWFLGDFIGNENYGGGFKFRIDDTDITYVKITGVISSSSAGESNTSNNTYIFPYEGISQEALLEGGVVLIDPNGKYDDDSDAIANGVNINEFYALSASNTYSLPEGIIKQVVDVSPSYVPNYNPNYVTPTYSPIYAPNYTPGYSPTYSPGYSPALYSPSYIESYAPNYTPAYVPNYTPVYLTPSYVPSYTPI